MARFPTPTYTRLGWHKKGYAERKAETSSIWIPDDMLFLRDAVSTWAYRNISDWNGTEKDARRAMDPPERPWLRIEGRRSDECLIYDSNGDEQIFSEEKAEKWWVETEPLLMKEREAELLAAKRWQDAVIKFRHFLASGDLVAQILTDSGGLFDMPKAVWLAKSGDQFFNNGFAKNVVPVGRHSASLGADGVILISRSAVQAVIDKDRKQRAGRKPKWDWAAAKLHIGEKFRFHGALSPEDPDWSHQAHVEKAIKEFFQSKDRNEPADSTARDKAREFISDFEAGNL